MPMKNYSSFSDWKKDQTTTNKKLITKISKVISGIAPDLEKTVKWGQGCWTEGKDHKIFIHGATDHIQLGFYNGAQLKDPKKLLQGKGQFVRHVKIFANQDTNNRDLENLIKQVL